MVKLEIKILSKNFPKGGFRRRDVLFSFSKRIAWIFFNEILYFLDSLLCSFGLLLQCFSWAHLSKFLKIIANSWKHIPFVGLSRSTSDMEMRDECSSNFFRRRVLCEFPYNKFLLFHWKHLDFQNDIGFSVQKWIQNYGAFHKVRINHTNLFSWTSINVLVICYRRKGTQCMITKLWNNSLTMEVQHTLALHISLLPTLI